MRDLAIWKAKWATFKVWRRKDQSWGGKGFSHQKDQAKTRLDFLESNSIFGDMRERGICGRAKRPQNLVIQKVQRVTLWIKHVQKRFEGWNGQIYSIRRGDTKLRFSKSKATSSVSTSRKAVWGCRREPRKKQLDDARKGKGLHSNLRGEKC